MEKIQQVLSKHNLEIFVNELNKTKTLFALQLVSGHLESETKTQQKWLALVPSWFHAWRNRFNRRIIVTHGPIDDMVGFYADSELLCIGWKDFGMKFVFAELH